MEEKKRRKRRAYLDSFQKDSSGNYVYQGDHYTFEPQVLLCIDAVCVQLDIRNQCVLGIRNADTGR